MIFYFILFIDIIIPLLEMDSKEKLKQNLSTS